VGEDRIYKGRFAGYKGMSCYQVLSTFCQRVYGGSFSLVGRTMYTQAAACEEEICFCTSGEGIICEHIERSYSRCRLISKVLVKLGAEGGYTTTLTDRDSSARGVCRQRYIDASSLSDISLSRAHSVIKEGRLSALQINLVTHRRASDFLGAFARAEGDGVSEEGLVVTAVAYTFKDRKELTKITLNSREE